MYAYSFMQVNGGIGLGGTKHAGHNLWKSYTQPPALGQYFDTGFQNILFKGPLAGNMIDAPLEFSPESFQTPRGTTPFRSDLKGPTSNGVIKSMGESYSTSEGFVKSKGPTSSRPSVVNPAYSSERVPNARNIAIKKLTGAQSQLNAQIKLTGNNVFNVTDAKGTIITQIKNKFNNSNVNDVEKVIRPDWRWQETVDPNTGNKNRKMRGIRIKPGAKPFETGNVQLPKGMAKAVRHGIMTGVSGGIHLNPLQHIVDREKDERLRQHAQNVQEAKMRDRPMFNAERPERPNNTRAERPLPVHVEGDELRTQLPEISNELINALEDTVVAQPVMKQDNEKNMGIFTIAPTDNPKLLDIEMLVDDETDDVPIANRLDNEIEMAPSRRNSAVKVTPKNKAEAHEEDPNPKRRKVTQPKIRRKK